MSKTKKDGPALRISGDVLQKIRQHARSCGKAEVCGVLIGRDDDGFTSVEACIAGVNAAQGGAHVTFTQDTWEHIYKIKDAEYPDERIVGWYHSHPGFGVFLSDHDTFIHKNFFSSLQQVAWVYDPHSDEEGCFGWKGGRIERLPHFSVVDHRGGEAAGETGKAEPARLQSSTGNDFGGGASAEDSERDKEVSRLARTVGTTFTYLAIFLLGLLLAWYVFPRVMVVPVPVDPQTGKPLRNSRPSSSQINPGEPTAPDAKDSGRSNNSDAKRNDVPER
jgi:proteasome lid subunit RPN8/RPN11